MKGLELEQLYPGRKRLRKKFVRSNAYYIAAILALFLGMKSHESSRSRRQIEQRSTLLDKVTTNPIKPQNRTIALIHVGKAGGLTLRSSTSLLCRLPRGMRPPAKIKTCIDQYFDPEEILALQTTNYMHMWAYDENELENLTTSFILTLRNPVDRIVSDYRYSHPTNCNEANVNSPKPPMGCHNAKKIENKPSSVIFKMFSTCFPGAGIEDFAQSTTSPWTNHSLFQNLTADEQWECKRMARASVEGRHNYGFMHMFYNYEYYANRSVWAFPDKEVFGVRMEHEWEDIVSLDLSLGGTGKFRTQGMWVSHGSEGYMPSPISTEAYQKICCVLEKEIGVYIELLGRTVNLNETAKQERIQSLADKCSVGSSWEEWRDRCKAKLNADKRILWPREKNIVM